MNFKGYELEDVYNDDGTINIKYHQMKMVFEEKKDGDSYDEYGKKKS